MLNLDGSEYCTPPSHLLMNFQAVSSAAYSTSFASVTSDTDVTLHPLDVVLDPDTDAGEPFGGRVLVACPEVEAGLDREDHPGLEHPALAIDRVVARVVDVEA